MKLVIIESPYAGEVLLNEAYAREAMRDSIINHGEAPLASHLLYTQRGILDDQIPEERQLGIDCGLTWSIVAKRHIFYTDRGWSRGMLDAFEFCVKHDKRVEYRALHGPIRLPNEYYRKIEEKSNDLT